MALRACGVDGPLMLEAWKGRNRDVLAKSTHLRQHFSATVGLHAHTVEE